MRNQISAPDREGRAPRGFTAFDPALRGTPIRLVDRHGLELPADPERWYARADADDQWLLDRCAGATLDLGCGPGRLVVALGERGIPALGVDCSEHAVRECLSRGGAAVHQDLFDTVPDEGAWDHVLLADGNIGIGGNPRRLLERVIRMLRVGGSLLVEAASDTAAARATEVMGVTTALWWSGQARLAGVDDPDCPVVWFPWAVVGARALTVVALDLGLTVSDHYGEARQFVQFRRLR